MTRTRLSCLIVCPIVTAMVVGASWSSWGLSDTLTPTDFAQACLDPWDICDSSWSPSCGPWETPCEECLQYCKDQCWDYYQSVICWTEQDYQNCLLCCSVHYSFCTGLE